MGGVVLCVGQSFVRVCGWSSSPATLTRAQAHGNSPAHACFAIVHARLSCPDDVGLWFGRRLS